MKILHLEDSPTDAELIKAILDTECPGCDIRVVEDSTTFIGELKRGGYDVILSDYRIPGFEGSDALTLARQIAPEVPFVFCSGNIGEDRAIAALRAGAADYVLKDRMKRLPTALQRAVRDAATQRARREAEAALRRSEENYRLVFDQANDAIFLAGADGRLLDINARAAQTLGYSRDMMLKLHLLDLLAPDNRALARANLALLRDGTPKVTEYTFVRADGTQLVGETSTKLLPDGRLLGIVRDITARKQAEAHIRELAMVINHAPLAVIILDLQHRVTYWNEGATRLYGRPAADAFGRNVEELFGAGPAATLKRDEWHGEVPLQTPDGRTVQTEVHLSLIHDEAGQPQARLSLGLDITEKKRFEEQFLRAQRMENLGLLAAGIAHDFNNILSPILMAATLFRRAELPARDAKLLDTLEQSGERGAALVRQILSFAYGSGAERHLVQLKHIARDIASLIEETFPRSLKLEHNIAADLRPVNANPTQLHQVLLNFCVNARDAMPKGGTLGLRARNCRLTPGEAAAIPDGRPGDFVVLEVSDTGSGIPADVLARIWEPFFTTKDPGKGTGLGLSTVRGIVTSHEGFVSVETKPGVGSTFRAYLPAVQQEPVRSFVQIGTVPAGRNELVLVVDDEANVRDLISVILGDNGYRILKARDGLEALNLLAAYKGAIQMIATDLQMPNLDGDGLIRIVRQHYPSIRILIVSAVSSLERLPGFKPDELGDGFLPKPFKPDALLAAVHNLLHGSARREK